MRKPEVRLEMDNYKDRLTATFVDGYGRALPLLNEAGYPANFLEDLRDLRATRPTGSLLERLARVDKIFRGMA